MSEDLNDLAVRIAEAALGLREAEKVYRSLSGASRDPWRRKAARAVARANAALRLRLDLYQEAKNRQETDRKENRMRTPEEARNQFAFHPATEETAPKHEAVRDAYGHFLTLLWELVPDGPEKTIAFRKLQESQMYAQLSVALTAPAEKRESGGR